MVKKFSVGISDELVARLEPFKGKYSPTAVFQKAMEKQAANLEKWSTLMPKGEEMDAIVEKLRKQKEEAEAQDYELGRDEGLKIAKSVDYEDLKAALKLIEEVEKIYKEYNYIQSDILFNDDAWGDYFSDSDNCHYELEALADSSVGSLTHASGKWFEGWRDGVTAFWDSLPEDLKS